MGLAGRPRAEKSWWVLVAHQGTVVRELAGARLDPLGACESAAWRP